MKTVTDRFLELARKLEARAARNKAQAERHTEAGMTQYAALAIDRAATFIEIAFEIRSIAGEGS